MRTVDSQLSPENSFGGNRSYGRPISIAEFDHVLEVVEGGYQQVPARQPRLDHVVQPEVTSDAVLAGQAVRDLQPARHVGAAACPAARPIRRRPAENPAWIDQ